MPAWEFNVTKNRTHLQVFPCRFYESFYPKMLIEYLGRSVSEIFFILFQKHDIILLACAFQLFSSNTTRFPRFYKNNLLYKSEPRLDTQDLHWYVILCQYQLLYRVVPKIQKSVSITMIKRSRFMVTHLYTMFSLYRKQSVDLFFQLSDLLPYDGTLLING